AALKLVSMKDKLINTTDLKELEILSAEFYDHYYNVYRHLPTISLSVAATIHYGVLRDSYFYRPKLTQRGVVPDILKTMQSHTSYHHSILGDFKSLTDLYFDHYKITPPEIVESLTEMKNDLNAIQVIPFKRITEDEDDPRYFNDPPPEINKEYDAQISKL